MTYHATTTLAEIRECYSHSVGFGEILKALGKKKVDKAPLHLLTILDKCGLDDALFCMRVKSLRRVSRNFRA